MNSESPFSKASKIVLNKLDNYLNESKKGAIKVLNQNAPSKIGADLNIESYLKKGGLLDHNFEHFLEKYLQNTQHLHHPHYLGHQVASPNLGSAMADFIHGTINNPMAIYEMGPAAATMEKLMVNWMLKKIGWLKTDNLLETNFELCKGAGILTHGGSLANLTALLAARAQVDPDAWNKGNNKNMMVMTPQNAHYSVAKSLAIMGMGYDSVIEIETDENEVIKPESLEPIYQKLKASGKIVMAVIANACATSTGLYDPIEAIGRFCNKNNLWFHVDGAHGASALLSSNKKSLLNGLELADSMVWDAHKMLQTSALCAAVLFKNHQYLHQTFKQKGSYLFFEKENVGFDLMGDAVECTKSPLGTKLFMAVACKGEQGLAKDIELTYNRTLEFYKLISANKNFKCPYKPESNILCFRYTAFSDDLQLKLRNELVANSNFYITTTTIKSTRYLRIAVMNNQTKSKHILNLLKEIETIAKTMLPN